MMMLMIIENMEVWFLFQGGVLSKKADFKSHKQNETTCNELFVWVMNIRSLVKFSIIIGENWERQHGGGT